MKWKTTVLLLVVTVAVGAYVSLYELKQPTPEEQKRRATYVVRLDPETVTRITLDLPQVKTTLTRRRSGWVLGPDEVRADAALIGQILDNLDPLESQRILTGTRERPLNLKEFGLNPAVGRIALASDKEPVTLLIGDQAPVSQVRYVKRADRPDVFLVPARLFSSLNQSTERFRDHALLHISSASAQRLTVTWPKGSYDVSRNNTTWQLTAPHDEADHAAVSGLLERLERLEIRKFVDDHPPAKPPSTWGFDQPAAQVTVLAGDPKASATTIIVGTALPENAALRYAKRSDEPFLYAIAAADLESLLAPAETLRNRRGFTFFTGTVTKLTVRWGDHAWTIQRAPGSPWIAEGSTDALDAGRVEGFLKMLADAQVERFVEDGKEKTGLEAPAGDVSVWTMTTEVPQQVTIGAEVNHTKMRYGRLTPRGVVAVLPEALITTLSTATVDQLKAQPPTTPPPVTAAKSPTPH